MADVFISYARSTAKQAQGAAAALRALGYSVWLDDDLAPHRAYTLAIEEQLVSAKSALVIWSADAAKSEWVLSEANRAREDHKLVQLVIDTTRLPMPFDQIQCADLAGWPGEGEHPNWRKVVASVGELVAGVATEPSAPVTGAGLPLPSKPSIAVLPFANLSSDPEQGYFADGMMEEIISALTRCKSIFVIAGGSTLSLKGMAVTPQAAARTLGVRYVLEGSVRRVANRVRIAVKLTDATDGAQIWADRFEDTLEDLFALQDRVALSVAGVIEPGVLVAEMQRISRRPTDNMVGYDLFLRALPLTLTFDPANRLKALDLLNRAIALDPDYGYAVGLASFCHAVLMWGSSPEGAAAHRREGLAMARHALSVSANDPQVLSVTADALYQLGEDPDTVIGLIDRALALNPALAHGWSVSGIVRISMGNLEVGAEHLQTALRFDPVSFLRPIVLCWLGISRFGQKRFDEAVGFLTESRQLLPRYPITLPVLASCYGHLADRKGAASALALSRAQNDPLPFTTRLFRNEDQRQLFLRGIALAEADV